MRFYLMAAAIAACLLCACGGSDPSDRDPGSNPQGGGGASGASAGMAGTGSGGNDFNNGDGGTTLPIAGQGGGADPDAGCGTSSVEAEQVIVVTEMEVEETITEVQPVALYVMLDQSASMQTGGLWDPAKTALGAFVDDASSAGVDIALEYFPPLFGETGECDGAGYSEPSVVMGRLPDQAAAIHGSLDAMPTATGIGTPIEGALRGATAFCQTFQTNNPTEKCIAVLVTDGVPQFGCSEDYAVITQIAADAHTAGVTTFAVGLSGADFELLDMIAMAGGAEDCSDAADRFACDVSGGASQLVEALNSIRDVVSTTTTHTVTMTMVEETPLECEWEIPEQPGMTFDKNLVNVELSSPVGGKVPLGQVANDGSCAARGWHYDDAGDPTRIIACDETCELIQSTSQASIDILLGCETVPLE